jgi:quercetin dioxygenase-like cupin family protein
MKRVEWIARHNAAFDSLAPGVNLRPLVGEASGARGLFTALASFDESAGLPYHTHTCAEAMIVLDGEAEAIVENRRYRLKQYDALHIPSGVPHSVRNAQSGATARLFVAFAKGTPDRSLVTAPTIIVECSSPASTDPERLTRFDAAEEYELAPQAMFRDLFRGYAGCQGICGGYGVFEPNSGLPCHTHDFDESITIIEGHAVCQVAGSEYELSDCDTALVPRGRPHRFVNRGQSAMAMIWVYAGDEPDRTILSQEFCDGTCELGNLADSMSSMSSASGHARV